MRKIKKHFNFDPEKNTVLKRLRGVSFDEIVEKIEAREVLDVIDHPNQVHYAHQRMYILLVHGYCHAVPFVTDENGVIFLKTIIPNRKLNKKYGVK